jgi:hypothetical protein
MQRRLGRALLALGALPLLAARALAHGGGLRAEAGSSLSVPTWLFLLTGGAVVGASFLLASLATDRSAVRAVHGWGLDLPSAPTIGRALWALGSALGLAGLAVVLYAGFLGPPVQLRNAAILLVWVGWWAGLPMVAYLLGNPWPALNPVRTLGDLLPSADLDYPEGAGAWPATVGVLALVWVEIIAPLAAEPRLLALVVALYVALSLAGAVAFGDDWFRHADPVSRVFRAYGEVGALTGGRLHLPGSGLVGGRAAEPGAVAFVVALLWGTTYDGLVGTELVAGLVPRIVAFGLPPRLVYALCFLAGYGAFLGAFSLAARLARRSAPTYATAGTLARRFAPALLPIAAGYHLAHYLAYFISLSPALAGAALVPWNPPEALVVSVPAWFSAVGPLAVLAGHLLAVWVAHAVAFEFFPGRLQAIRSQYPLTAAMVVYTTVSLWVITQPEVTPAYL